MSADNKPKDNSGVVKWIVIGVVLITALITFKGPLERLVDRITGVDIDPKTGKFLITTHTAIGELKVSSETVNEKEAEKLASKDQENKYVVADNYMMSWPKATWSKSETGRAQMQEFYNSSGINARIDVYCQSNTPNQAGGYNNAFIATLDYDDRYTWEEQVAAIRQGIEAGMENVQFLTFEVDPKSKGALIIYTYKFGGFDAYQIQRYAYKNGKMIQLAATTFAHDDTGQKDVNEIVNSFRIVNS